MSALLPILAAIATQAQAGQVTGVDIAEDRIVVRFDGTVAKATSFVLAGPDRIAVDIEGGEPGSAVAGSGPVSRVRQGNYVAGTTRIVFDMSAPQKVRGGRFSDDGRELVLDLAPLDDEALARAVAAPRKLYLPPEAHRAAPPRSRYSVTVDIPPMQSGLPRPRIMGPAGRPLVVIDAGHGGHDPGAIGASGAREKDITLALAKSIRDELLAGGRVRVAMTRDDDRFLVLGERAQIARGLKADLFISVHADSAPGTEATGATIYTLSEVASSRNAAALAARENRADIINGVNLGGESNDVSSILIDLAQRETINASARFADLVKREARAVPFKRDYHQMAGLAVLKAPDMPAILFEAGYISSASDVARITSGEGKQAIADSLRRAVDVHFARRIASR
ncbi:N-acetylmuramoyl-L-alanine amidase [Sphingomonas sp. SUN039]|uniref:N-acetylmuramoyl-L-alanine amidase n=1 Tax=Sphingomonas sp. SUN039 TaxID=2937787 RepID=UPI0028696CFF|nr:N-acetylmuramoyl-L-alanine amidase [Sphingomonas sp. SUN039]